MNKVIALSSTANGVNYFMHGLLFLPVIPAGHVIVAATFARAKWYRG